MKKLSLFVFIVLSAFFVNAQPPEGPADKGMVFGNKLEATNAVSPNELPALLKDKKDVDVKVMGKVVEVCKAEGCWLKMETAKGPIMIRMKNHAFMVPVSMNGKTIVVSGVANNKETSVDMLKHYAEDAGKTKAEIDAIKEPKQEILIQATGILVV